VILTRAEEPALALIDGRAVTVRPPRLEVVDHRGAGDSMTAGVAAGLARGLDLRGALRLGAAAAGLNVTRRGLATGDRREIERLADHIDVQPLEQQRPTEERTRSRA
jgi:1-phosphofructokinase